MATSPLPERFGRYRVRGELGRGGMGVVYLVLDETLAREVALKVMAPHASQPEHLQRFLREAQAAAQLHHPGVATVFDVGTDGGVVFIAMERVQGESLRRALEHGPLPPRRAVEVVRQLADAVGHAHQLGVVHRDLKPDNVVLTPSGQAKVLDFGIAKWSGPGSGELATATGALMGTAGYLAPEQAGAGPVDHRADLFALGVILFECLTGRLPFRGESPLLTVAATIRDPAPSLAALGCAAPPELERLVAQCLEKAPAARPPHAAALVAALDALLPQLPAVGDAAEGRHTGPGEAHGPTGTSVMPAYTPRSGGAGTPTDLSFGATVAATPGLVPGGAGSGGWPGAAAASVELGGAPADTGEPTAREAGPPARARGWRWALGAAAVLVPLAAVAGWRLSQGPRAGQPATGPSPSASVAPALRLPAVGLAALERYAAPTDSGIAQLRNPGFWSSARADFEAAAGQPGAPVRWQAGERFCAGQVALATGRAAEAERAFGEALALDPELALAEVARAAALVILGRHDDALSASRRAESRQPGLWIAIVQSARTLGLKGEAVAAVGEYRRALEKTPRNAAVLGELALAYHAAHMDEEAQRTGLEALRLDGDLVSVRVLLAERALEAGQGAEALEHASRATSVSPDHAGAWLARGDAQVLLGRADDARSSYRTALAAWKKQAGDGAPAGRLQVVARALDQGRLPAPRRVPVGGAALVDGGRSLPAPRPTKLPGDRGLPGARGDGGRTRPDNVGAL